MRKTTKVEKSSGQFEQGHEKTGGRKKGTPNKKTKELVTILGSFNPAEELKDLYYATTDDELKVTICKELMKYIYPQRKAIDVKADNVKLPEINIKGI